jgi:hypothetical protein
MKKTKTWRLCSGAALALFFAQSFAADLTIRFGSKGDREIWVLAQKPTSMPVGGRAFTSDTVKMPVPQGSAGGYVVALDTKSGNVAMAAIPGLEGGNWSPGKGDWRVGQVRVEAFSRGNPVPKGAVEASVSGYVERKDIENGGVTFFAVPPGDVRFSVKYTSGGASKSSPAQVFRVSLQRDETVPTLAITVTDRVDSGLAKAREPEKGSSIVNGIIWLITLGAGVALLYWILKTVRDREGSVEAGLKKFGVQIPGQQAADDVEAQGKAFEPEPLVPEGHCRFCGRPLAADGSCVCSVGSTSVAAVATGPPRLVGSETFEIPEGIATLGREGDLVVSDPTVSRQHAEIERSGEEVSVRDLGSSNGTFVNGAKLDSERVLCPGDTVQFGAVRYRFEA